MGCAGRTLTSERQSKRICLSVVAPNSNCIDEGHQPWGQSLSLWSPRLVGPSPRDTHAPAADGARTAVDAERTPSRATPLPPRARGPRHPHRLLPIPRASTLLLAPPCAPRSLRQRWKHHEWCRQSSFAAVLSAPLSSRAAGPCGGHARDLWLYPHVSGSKHTSHIDLKLTDEGCSLFGSCLPCPRHHPRGFGEYRVRSPHLCFPFSFATSVRPSVSVKYLLNICCGRDTLQESCRWRTPFTSYLSLHCCLVRFIPERCDQRGRVQ